MSEDKDEEFEKMIDNEDPYVQADAVKALGTFKYHKAADRLLKILHDRIDDEFSVDRSVWLSASTALAELQDERAIIPMLKILHDQEKYESRVVLDAVVEFGEKALGPVINELKNASSDLMLANAMEVIEELQDVRGLGPVLDHLEDERDFVRRSVFCAVESICKKNKCMPLKHVLESFLRDEHTGKNSREFIRRRCKEDGLNMLLNEMQQKEQAARETVAGALRDSQDRLLTIIDLLNKRDIHIRKEAVRSLGEMNGPEPAGVLMSVLGDSDREVRDEVITALGKLKEARAVSRLAGMMEKSRDSTQRRIIEALGEIGTDEAIWIILIAYSLVHLDGLIDSTIKKLGTRTVPHILKIMENPGVSSRMYCYVYILGELKAEDAVPRLQELLNDDEMSIIHEYVEKALVKIGVEPDKKEKKEGKSGTGKMTSFMSFDTFKKLND